MIVIDRIADLRTRLDDARARGGTVGFVPTMGAFHAGHRSLMRAARNAHDVVVVSVFVNPLQFDRAADLDQYPRDLGADAAVAEAEDVDILFAPTVAEMYPRPVVTTVSVAGLTDNLCGAARPGHFNGVATVVTKLFSIVGPSTAYFGRKDAQQLAVVRRLAADLNLSVTVVGCPLVREFDGLAMSSRNVHLSPAERVAATSIFRGLRAAAAAIEAGGRDSVALREAVLAEFDGVVRVDYVEVVDAETIAPIARIDDAGTGESLIAVAAFVGTTRLIDNIHVSIAIGAVSIEAQRTRTDVGILASPLESEAPCAAG